MNLVLFVLLTPSLSFVRRFTGWRISKRSNSETLESSGKPQFGMKYLLGWTAATAIVLATGRFILDFFTSADDVPVWQQEIVIQTAAFMGLFLGVLIPIFAVPRMTLARHWPRIVALVFVLAVWCALTWMSCSAMIRFAPRASRSVKLQYPWCSSSWGLPPRDSSVLSLFGSEPSDLSDQAVEAKCPPCSSACAPHRGW